MWNLENSIHRNKENINGYSGVGFGVGSGIGEDGQKVQTSSSKVNKFWVCNVQHGNYAV